MGIAYTWPSTVQYSAVQYSTVCRCRCWWYRWHMTQWITGRARVQGRSSQQQQWWLQATHPGYGSRKLARYLYNWTWSTTLQKKRMQVLFCVRCVEGGSVLIYSVLICPQAARGRGGLLDPVPCTCSGMWPAAQLGSNITHSFFVPSTNCLNAARQPKPKTIWPLKRVSCSC